MNVSRRRLIATAVLGTHPGGPRGLRRHPRSRERPQGQRRRQPVGRRDLGCRDEGGELRCIQQVQDDAEKATDAFEADLTKALQDPKKNGAELIGKLQAIATKIIADSTKISNEAGDPAVKAAIDQFKADTEDVLKAFAASNDDLTKAMQAAMATSTKGEKAITAACA